MNEPFEQPSQPPPKPSLAAQLSVAFLFMVFGGLLALYSLSQDRTDARSSGFVASLPARSTTKHRKRGQRVTRTGDNWRNVVLEQEFAHHDAEGTVPGGGHMMLALTFVLGLPSKEGQER
jgi:hypothetical protein